MEKTELNIKTEKMPLKLFEDNIEAVYGYDKRWELHQNIKRATHSICGQRELNEIENVINKISISFNTAFFETRNLNSWEEISPSNMEMKIKKWAIDTFGEYCEGNNVIFSEIVPSYETVTFVVYLIPIVKDRSNGKPRTYINDEDFWDARFREDHQYGLYMDFFINVVLRYNLYLEYDNIAPSFVLGQDIKELMDKVQDMIYKMHRCIYVKGIDEYLDC